MSFKKEIIFPIKMEDFFDAEISIYSRPGFFYLFVRRFSKRFSVDFSKRFSVDISQRRSKIFYKTNKMQVFA